MKLKDKRSKGKGESGIEFVIGGAVVLWFCLVLRFVICDGRVG